jgi:hypothetical protein
MKRPINWWMIASAGCFVFSAVLFTFTRNWWMLGLAFAFQISIFAFDWADRGILKDFFRK